MAFCAHAILEDDLFEGPDTLADPRFAHNALVIGEPNIRFYAGAPLIGSEGHRYGTLCVIDIRPRRLDPRQREALQRLARLTSAALETRAQKLSAQTREQTLVHLLEAMPDGVVTCNADGVLGEFNKAAREWHGVDPRALPPGEWASYFGLFEPDGEHILHTDHIPLLRAWNGEHVRQAEIVLRANGQLPRTVLCNAEPLRSADGVLLGAVCVMHDVTRLKRAVNAAHIEANRFLDAFAAAAQGMALVSLEGKWLDANDALCAILGYSRTELLVLDFQGITHPEDLSSDLDLVTELLQGRRKSYQLDKRYFNKRGQTIWAHLSVSVVRDATGLPLHFVAQIQDFTQRYLIEQRLRDSETRLRTITDNLPALISHIGADLRYEFANKAYEEWFGFAPGTIVGRHMREVLQPAHFNAIQPKLEQVFAGHAVAFEMEIPDHAGSLRHMHLTYIPDMEPVCDAEIPVCRGFHVMVHDISVHKQLAHMFEERAMTDALTGLPNRVAWMEELERGVARANRGKANAATVMFLDLDGFKQVNDTYGHGAGDAVLREFALRLKSAMRKNDYVARLSGDEFVVLLDQTAVPGSDALLVAQKILDVCAAYIAFEGHELRVQPSIGIAVQAGPNFDAVSLVRHADEAMYVAKRCVDHRIELVEC